MPLVGNRIILSQPLLLPGRRCRSKSVELLVASFGLPSTFRWFKARVGIASLCRLSRFDNAARPVVRASSVVNQQQQYEFTKEEEAVFEVLNEEMRGAAVAFAAVAAAEVLHVLMHGGTAALLRSVQVLATCFNKLFAALLLLASSNAFKQVYATKGRDIENLMDGLNKLSKGIMEVGINTCALAILNVAVAGAQWPLTMQYVAGLLSCITAARWITFCRPQLLAVLDHLPQGARVGVMALAVPVFGCNSPISNPAQSSTLTPVEGSAGGDVEGDGIEYEFSRIEEQVFRAVVSTLYFCALAMWLGAAASLALVFCSWHHGSATHVVHESLHCIDCVLMVGVLMRAGTAFDSVITSTGRDITHLLEGLGLQQGMACLFEDLAHVNWLIAVGLLAEAIGIPMLQRTGLLRTGGHTVWLLLGCLVAFHFAYEAAKHRGQGGQHGNASILPA